MTVLRLGIESMKVCLYVYSVGVGGVCHIGIETFGLIVETGRSGVEVQGWWTRLGGLVYQPYMIINEYYALM